MEAVARTFRPLWLTKGNFHITNTGSNILLFDFDLEVDAEKVLLSEPWSYDRHLVIFQCLEGSMALKEIEFKFCSFWIQMHDVPFKYMTVETAREIGETVGPIIKPGDDSELKGWTFLRVRVKIDTTHPLCRGRKVTFEEGLERWISFQYERLSNFCFWCGMLSHDDKECETWLHSKGSLTVEQQQFGHWIRANPVGLSERHTVEVKGLSSPIANNLLSRASPSEGVVQ